MSPIYVTRAGIAGTVVAVIVAAVCVRLGIWQLDRLEERRTHNRIVAERMHQPPAPLSGLSGRDEDPAYRPVTVHGEYDHARSMLLPGRTYQGMTGLHILTPLRLEDGGAILVNRGWLPATDPGAVDLDRLRTTAPDPVRGLLLPYSADESGANTLRPVDPSASADTAFRRTRYRMKPADLAAPLPYPILNAYVQAIPTPESDPATAGLRRLPPPTLEPGPHLGYAIQWFSFATIALVGWGILALRNGDVGRRRPPRTR